MCSDPYTSKLFRSVCVHGDDDSIIWPPDLKGLPDGVTIIPAKTLVGLEFEIRGVTPHAKKNHRSSGDLLPHQRLQR